VTRCEAVVQSTFTSLIANASEAQNCDNAERCPPSACERTQRGRDVTSVFDPPRKSQRFEYETLPQVIEGFGMGAPGSWRKSLKGRRSCGPLDRCAFAVRRAPPASPVVSASRESRHTRPMRPVQQTKSTSLETIIRRESCG
jgi:hypothetical protein